MQKKPSKQTPTQQTGSLAEDIVAFWLASQGSKILTRNYHSRRGEIDLIIQEGEVLTFVEVRSRLGAPTGQSLASIQHKKQQRIQKAAQSYIMKHCPNEEPHVAFSCVGVSFRWDGSIVCRREPMLLW